GPISFSRGSSDEVRALAFSADGATLAAVGREVAKLWDVATGRALLELGTRNTLTGIAFTADCRRLAISRLAVFGEPGGVDSWRLEWGRGLQTLHAQGGQVSQVRFSSDGQRLAALSHNWQVAIWETASGRLEYLFDVPRGVFADNAALAFSRDAQKFAFAAGQEAKLWDLAPGAGEKRWSIPPGLLVRLRFDD